MHQLTGIFTQKSNQKHQLLGDLFQGQYQAILVQKESYLLELSPYVLLITIHAQMISDMSDLLWSNYATMIGEVRAPQWLKTG